MTNKTNKLLKKMTAQPKVPQGGLFIPNHSGKHDAGIQERTPTADFDISNKKYVDDQISALNSADWVLVETKTITSAVQTFDFTDSGSQFVGENIKAARIIMHAINDNASAAGYGLRLNGAAVTADYQEVDANNTTLAAVRNSATTLAKSLTIQNEWCTSVWLIPFTKKDTGGRSILFQLLRRGTGPVTRFCNGCGSISTPADSVALTSIGVAATQTTGLGVDTRITLEVLL